MKLSLCTHLIWSQSLVLPSIGTVAMFGYNVFQSKRAHIFEQLSAITLHLLGKLYRANRIIEQVRQRRTESSVFVRSCPSKYKIESKEDGFGQNTFAATSAERTLQGSEFRAPFAVQNGGPDPELFGSRRNCRKPM